MLCCFKLPSHLCPGLLQWEEGGERVMPFLGSPCFFPSCNPGYSVRAAFLLLSHYHACWTLIKCQTGSAATVPVLPHSTYPTHSSLTTFRCSDAWIFQVYLVLSRGSFVVIVVSLGHLRIETKKVPHFSIMLMLTSFFTSNSHPTH